MTRKLSIPNYNKDPKLELEYKQKQRNVHDTQTDRNEDGKQNNTILYSYLQKLGYDKIRMYAMFVQ